MLSSSENRGPQKVPAPGKPSIAAAAYGYGGVYGDEHEVADTPRDESLPQDLAPWGSITAPPKHRLLRGLESFTPFGRPRERYVLPPPPELEAADGELQYGDGERSWVLVSASSDATLPGRA